MRVPQIVPALVCVVAATVAAQPASSPQQLFESGQSEQALQVLAEQQAHGEAGPAEAYLAGLIAVKLDQPDRARAEFARLGAMEDQAWVAIGASAIAVLDGDNELAREHAGQAVTAAPASFHAHYQLGLARSRFEDWGGSAAAFREAAELNPGFAYAHYYAGLSYSRIGRADRTSEHFERFLRLAPRAPERAAVESLMRTLRGR